jgi:hypothetical protein
MSRILEFCQRRLLIGVLWFGKTFLGWSRLKSIDLINLGTSMADVTALYGEADESEPDKYLSDATTHTFSIGPFHEAVIVEWKGRVCWITYWSPYGDRNQDLKCMLTKYGGDVGWNELEPGYVCVRKDGRVWLRCSAAPAISVETAEYLDAKRAASEQA